MNGAHGDGPGFSFSRAPTATVVPSRKSRVAARARGVCIERGAGTAHSRRRLAISLAFVLLFAAWSAAARGQEGILSFSTDPASVALAPGGQAMLTVRVENVSVREADDIELVWTGPEEYSLTSDPAVVSVLGAFASTTIRLAVAAAPSVPLGELQGHLLDAIYTYCIDDLCYEIVEPVEIALRVVSPEESAPDVPRTGGAPRREPGPLRSPWPLAGLALAGILVVFSSRARWARMRPALCAALAVAGGLTVAFGVSLGQHRQAQAVGAVLCTSCVGIETSETTQPSLSAAQKAGVDRIATPVDLLVFYAEWCRSCPYAEALVDLVASRNPLVRYRLVDAEVERDLATSHGVTRAGRTVVPAVVCLQTGGVLFGAEDLADRLLTLLLEVR